MIRPDPRKIIVPRKHGEVLVEPALGVLAEALKTRQAKAGVGGADRFEAAFGKRIEVLRTSARQALVQAAVRHAQATGVDGVELSLTTPWIVTGHQVEFYHAGVWAKVLAADALARMTGAAAIDLLVDHDLVEHMGMDVPARDEAGKWRREAVVFGDASPLPVEFLHAPGLGQFEKWDEEVARYPAAGSDAMAFFLARLRPGSEAPAEEPYAVWMSRARRAFEESMGVRVVHVTTSALCDGIAWEAFVGAWIEHAAEWTLVYNQHLAAYRKRQGIKSAQHPMPDLVRDQRQQVYELPFWVYRENQARGRMTVRIEGTQRQILHGDKVFPVDREHLLHKTPLLVRPRALSLTMYARLFLADLFIHGIGGALYDQITDGILEELLGPENVPAYACVSAAWLLPLEAKGESDDDLSSLHWQRHHLLHNPQRAIDPFTALRMDVAELITQRRELIERLTESVRTARRAGRAERRAWFDDLHATNRRLHEKAPAPLAKLERKIAEAVVTHDQRQVTQWREWFFGLHDRASLQRLMEQVGRR